MNIGENAISDFYNGSAGWRPAHMQQLEKGKLYQVRFGKEWVIAEYVSAVPAHTAHGWNPQKRASAWPEPDSHFWKAVAHPRLRHFGTHDRGMQVRPVTEETLAEITRLKANIETKRQEMKQAEKALLDLCA